MAAILDKLGTDAKLICIHDHAGNLLLGKAPAKEFSISAGLIGCALGLEPKGKGK